MSDIIEELLAAFRSSSQQLEELTTGLEELQDAQKLVETLSKNLGEAASSLNSTATAHGTFIKSAKDTDDRLGQVVSVLQGLDTQAINKTLAEISKDLNQNKGELVSLVELLNDSQAKVVQTEAHIVQMKKEIESIVTSNTSLSEQVANNQKYLLRRSDEAAALARSRHKQSIFLILIAIGCTGVFVVSFLLGMISI
jgi:cell division protein FtsB